MSRLTAPLRAGARISNVPPDSMITRSTTVTVTAGLTAAELGGEAVILDANTGKYYGLNELGTRIFDLIRHPRTVGDVVQALLQEYEVTEEQLERDVIAFLHSMEQRRLVDTTDEAAV